MLNNCQDLWAKVVKSRYGGESVQGMTVERTRQKYSIRWRDVIYIDKREDNLKE